MKLAIIGSRNLSIDISNLVPNNADTIISGGASGIDKVAKKFALDNHLEYIEFAPNYKDYGKGSLFIRNRQIIDACDEVLAIWDGTSKGTLYTINYAKKTGKQINLIIVNPNNQQKAFAF